MSDHRKSFDEQRYVVFITFSVFKRRRLLDLDHPKRIVLGVLSIGLHPVGMELASPASASGASRAVPRWVM